jgi:FSR family fosmidomycin resistance protein-like MFS transporter
MSLFSIGGNLGYGLGPLVITACIAWLGLRGAYVVAIPAVVVAAALVALRPYLGSFVPEPGAHAAVAGEDRRGAMAVLLGVIACRNVAWFGLVTFVPLWEVSLGHSKSYGNHLLALMLLCGGIGTLILGPAADRFGRRSVLVGSVVVTAPLILVFVAVGGVLGAVALGLVGACVVGTFGVTAVVAQEYLPRHVGMASGLTIGFALGLGGTAALVLGKVADATSLRTALYVCVVSPVLALAFAAFLPPTTTRRPLEPEVVLP